MKRIYSTILLAIILIPAYTQIQVNDTMWLFMDSLLMELPEIMVKGERPIVKSEEGKLVYDLPRLVNDLPIDNTYDAIKELPGVVDIGNGLTIAGSSINIVIDGKVSTLSYEQLTSLLKSIPVSRIQKAEVMLSAPAKYQVRGPMINIVLKSGESEIPKLQGEVFSAWEQKFYERLTERASLLYSSSKFSTDLLYSFNHARRKSGIDKEALHTVNGVVYPMNTNDRSKGKGEKHNIRWGMDYRITNNNLLSMVYTTELSNSKSDGTTTGTENSTIHNSSNDQLHNIKTDYNSSFGLTLGAEFTFYKSPGSQEFHSILNEQEINARYEDEQKINRWRFYATQEHSLKNDWKLNYGLNYTTAVDNSFQYYYNTETGILEPENSMKVRRKEYTTNGFIGLNKSFGSKVTLDASFAAELYHTEIWDEWMYYPTFNLNYLPAPGHILQLSFSSDKKYPSFWSVNNSIAYTSAYTEIHGNPDLKPNPDYQASLTYILKSKYVFTAFYNYQPDYSTQVLYQRPDKLVEVYKYFNFDYRKQAGLQATIPFKFNDWLNSRVTVVGYYLREKDSDFWDIPFTRDAYSFMINMSNSFKLSTKPDIALTISGYYQNGAIQGIYDLSRSGTVDVGLRWKSDNDKMLITLKGTDLFETSQVKPSINFKGQNVTNKFITPTRAFEISFAYKFGNYKEKKRDDVDTSRFK